MSVIKLVREKYKMAIGKTDNTDKCAYDSNVSPTYSELKIQFPDLDHNEIPVVLEMLRIQEMRNQGVVPNHYTSTTECKHCGGVPIWEGCTREVLGCPWCFNRLKGLPIPRAPHCEEDDE